MKKLNFLITVAACFVPLMFSGSAFAIFLTSSVNVYQEASIAEGCTFNVTDTTVNYGPLDPFTDHRLSVYNASPDVTLQCVTGFAWAITPASETATSMTGDMHGDTINTKLVYVDSGIGNGTASSIGLYGQITDAPPLTAQPDNYHGNSIITVGAAP